MVRYHNSGTQKFDDTEHESLNANQSTIGDGPDQSGITPRPMFNNSFTTVSVPGDYSTIQAALDDVPYHLRHDYRIEIDETQGDYGEDIIVPPFLSMSLNDSTSDDNAELRLTRQGGSGRWTTTSVFAHGGFGSGYGLRLDFFEVTDENPYDNENAAIGIYGGGECKVFGPKITPDTTISKGIMSYGSSVFVDGNDTEQIDYSAGSVDTAFYAKNGGYIETQGEISNYAGTAENQTMTVVSGTGVALEGAMSDNWSTAGGDAQIHVKGDPSYLAGPERFEVSNFVDNIKFQDADDGSLFDLIRRSSDNNNIEILDPTGTARLTMTENGYETALNGGSGNGVFVSGASGNPGRGEIRDTNGVRVQVRDGGDIQFYDTSGSLIGVLREASGDLDLSGSVNENQTL